MEHLRFRLDRYTDRIVRVRVTPTDFATESNSEMVVLRPQAVGQNAVLEVDQDAEGRIVFSSEERTLLGVSNFSFEAVDVIQTEMDPESLVLKATVDGERVQAKIAKQTVIRRDWKARVYFEWDETEALYGLGMHEEDALNLRGKMQYVYQHNLKASVPMLTSTKGYGLLFNKECAFEFHDDEAGSYMEYDSTDEIDFFFIQGGSLDGVITGYRELTGRVGMMPKWLFGYCQSKERYNTQEELVSVAREFRERKIPIDLIVQDWHYWPDGWGGKHFDAARYPDPKRLCDEIHALDMKVMISIWPNMMDSINRPEMIAAGGMLNDHSVYNAFDPAARDLYWKQTHDGIHRHGFDAWWCDSTEPYIADWSGETSGSSAERAKRNLDEFKLHMDAARVNAYSLYHSKGIYENQRAAAPDKRVVNLTRSAYAGQQRYGTITWPGDPSAKWSTLRQHIPALLNFSASGCPYSTMDIGAFFVRSKEQWFWSGEYEAGCEDLGYRELYTRWFQFGAFLPLFRSHGTDTPREPWRFGEPGTPFYDVLLRFIELRYRLLPYIYSIAGWITQRHYTMVRPLAFDFTNDPQVYDLKDQFMFGPSLMVCPVLEPMYYEAGSKPLAMEDKTRSVYLPEGCDWYDFWTGKKFKGGQHIKADAVLEKIPLFVRAGSIIPLGPCQQFVGEKTSDDLILMIYPGADASFDLYEDEGEGYAYESGAYSITPLTWHDARSQLHVHARQGSFDGMIERHMFRAANMAGFGYDNYTEAPPVVCGGEA